MISQSLMKKEIQTPRLKRFSMLKLSMVNIMDNNNTMVGEVSLLDYIEKVKVVYPKVEEELIDFLNR